jgi:Flp pilus assembly protein TadG
MAIRVAVPQGRLRDGERGSALAESVIVLGLLALLVFGVLQYAADEHAEQAAQSAASLALATARAQNGTAGQGQAAAQQLLAGLTGAIHDTSVSVDRTATQVTVHVTGHVDTLLGLTQTITVTDAGPVEKFEPNVLGLTNPGTAAARTTDTGSPP